MPIGNGDRRYSPCESVTEVTDGTCRAGLVAVTVTPGRIAPVPSVTCPMMPAADAPPPWPAVAIAAAGSRLIRIDKTMNEADLAQVRFNDAICLLLVLVPNRALVADSVTRLL